MTQLLQGTLDAVVPPAQSEAMAQTMRENGGEVELIMFEGEGHGWRKSENITKAVTSEWEYYDRVLLPLRH